MNKTELINEVDNKFPEMKELVKALPFAFTVGICEWVDKKKFGHREYFNAPISSFDIKKWLKRYLPEEGYNYTLTYKTGMGSLIVSVKGMWEG